jgi:hypothetical protein
LGVADEKEVMPVTPVPEIIEPPEESSDPSFAQINQSKMDLLSWQVRYWKEHKRAVELEYTGLVFKDVRHQLAIREITRIEREAKQLILH